MINLSKCSSGDKLLTASGKIVTYVKKCDKEDCHIIQFSNGAFGIRTNRGEMYKEKLFRGPDNIVKMLSVTVKRVAKKKTKRGLTSEDGLSNV